jgi:DNA polymerase III gamma/tau subunit
VGAPKSELLSRVVEALQKKDAESALSAVAEAVEAAVDMRLFTELLLERLRSILLFRHTKHDDVFAAYAENDKQTMRDYALDAASPINSKLLDRFLDALEVTGKTYLPQLPLELAIIDICNSEK